MIFSYTLPLCFFLFFVSMIYYMGHRGRPWQVHSTYLDKEKEKKERKTNIESNEVMSKKRGDKGCTFTPWTH